MHKKPNVVGQMTAEQTALLRKIAFDAYEPEAFSPNLTKAEAARRIDHASGQTEIDERTATHPVTEFANCRPQLREEPLRASGRLLFWTGLQRRNL